jgi:hypothetical protein
MRKIALALLLAGVPVAAHAQTMTVADFLAKAEALKKKGAMALFSSDIGKLKGEIQGSGKQLRDEQLAARKAGRQPTFCPPEAGKTSITRTSCSLISTRFRPPQRGMSVKAALRV